MDSKFAKVPERPDFPQEEEKVLSYWKDIDAFHTQNKLSEGRKEYTFYDGPPFATGLPHYGHIAAGTIKDVMTRYAIQTGHHCNRRFGWDCHGLPIEYEIDKKFNIKSSAEREEIGVKEYNRRCREIVMTYSKEWENIVNRFGRWIDFQNDYKTMDKKFMESVWYTFKTIYDKGLVYRGARIMPFSTACNTVLSNFEAGSNYKDAKDPSIYITFPLVDDPETSLLAWTTTPWTLPSNLAAVVNPEFVYLKIKDEEKNKVYIVAECRLKEVLKQTNIKKHVVLDKMKGSDLVGKQYVPLFDYFEHMREQKCFTIIPGSFVTADAGTGIVHCAPGFGEDDYKVAIDQNLIQPGKAVMPMNDDGQFLSSVKDFEGQYFKDADAPIMQNLKERGRMIASGTVVHSYPFCWRSETPLMYRAISTWFIRVTDIKDQLLANNETPLWVPAFVQEKRFKNWLQDARDWCFSRNRYWGNPIPIWMSDDGEEMVCVGSIKELQELSGCGDIEDLHREHIDHITIPSKQGKGQLKRIPEVFDCWFESGSMPFAQCNYPFTTNEEEFAKQFPGDFIAEGLDQTRGWFYTLMVISTAVKGCAPFKNLIVNGIVLAANGQKMSKRLKNYPDPLYITNSYGADACRLYLCNSPVVRAEQLQFKEEGVKNVVREIFLPWFNSYRFLIQNISRYEQSAQKNFVFDPNLMSNIKDANLMDKWIISATQNLIRYVRKEMDSYKLYLVVRPLLSFLEKLSNWYVRLNRTRMKGEEGLVEQQRSLNVLFEVIFTVSTLMASITPFICEHIYQNLKNGLPDGELKKDSIHFLQIPSCNESLIDEAVELKVARMQSAIENGRLIRDRKVINLKTPLSCVTLVDLDKQALQDLIDVQQYIKEELNCLELAVESDEDKFIRYTCEPDNKEMGAALKKQFDKNLKNAITALDSNSLRQYLKDGFLMINDIKIEQGWLKVQKNFKDEFLNSEQVACATDEMTAVMINTVINDDLKNMGMSREITNKIQKLRKSTGISIDDQIEVFYSLPQQGSPLNEVLKNHAEKIRALIKMPFLPMSHQQPFQTVIGQTTFENPANAQDTIELTICKQSVHLNHDEINKAYSGDNKVDLGAIFTLLNSMNPDDLKKQVTENNGVFKLNLELKHGTHFFFSGRDRETTN